jgi:hypothetical protein
MRGQLDRRNSFRLSDKSESNAFPLGEVVTLISFNEQLDNAGLDYSARDRNVNGVGALKNDWYLAAGGKKPFEQKIDASAFAFHQLYVVENAGEGIIPAAALVKNILRSDTDG